MNESYHEHSIKYSWLRSENIFLDMDRKIVYCLNVVPAPLAVFHGTERFIGIWEYIYCIAVDSPLPICVQPIISAPPTAVLRLPIYVDE